MLPVCRSSTNQVPLPRDSPLLAHPEEAAAHLPLARCVAGASGVDVVPRQDRFGATGSWTCSRLLLGGPATPLVFSDQHDTKAHGKWKMGSPIMLMSCFDQLRSWRPEVTFLLLATPAKGCNLLFVPMQRHANVFFPLQTRSMQGTIEEYRGEYLHEAPHDSLQSSSTNVSSLFLIAQCKAVSS